MSSTRLATAAAALLPAVLLALPQSAAASPSQSRTGWLAGGSLGFGSTHVTDDSGNEENLGMGTIQAFVGGHVTPNLALLVEGFGGFHTCEDCPTDSGIDVGHIGLSARYLPSDSIWLSAGLTSARLGAIENGRVAHLLAGPGMALGAGYVFYQGPRADLDLQLRIYAASFKDTDIEATTSTLSLGLTFH